MNKNLELTDGEIALLEMLLMDERRRAKNLDMPGLQGNRDRIISSCNYLLYKLEKAA